MFAPCLLLLGAFAADDRPAVRDDAGLFGAAARQTADDEIRVFRRDIEKTHPDRRPPEVVIETASSPPDDLRQKTAGMKASQAEPLFHDWAEGRAEAKGVEGVYVLVCADPGDVEVVVRPDDAQAAFTAWDARRLRNLLRSMKAGPRYEAERDRKLLSAVAHIGEDFRYNLRPPFPWLPVGAAVAGALGLWGALALVRRTMYVAPSSAGPATYAGLLGERFGSTAGNWIYDGLFAGATTCPVSRDAPAEGGQITRSAGASRLTDDACTEATP